MVEPWLRGTLTEFDAVRRQVLHALQLTSEDCTRWCSSLTLEELGLSPFGLPSVAFQMRHTVRSLDRLLTYLEGRQLMPEQMLALQTEADPFDSEAGLFREFQAGMASAAERVRAVSPLTFEEVRGVGRSRLPSTVGGLLVHCAEHTQRHTGQMVTTAKLVVALR